MNFKFETLTAVHIGSGEILSPYSDYVFDNGFVYYLDHDLLVKELIKRPNSDELLERFIMVVKNQAKGSSSNRFKLKSFLEEAGLDYKNCALKKVKVHDEVRVEIQKHISTSGQPYIPGSSLKGAIRTALICFFPGISEETLRKKSGYIGEDIFGKFGDDVLKYLHISDTTPFKDENLAIAKFCRFNLETLKRTIPIVREVIPKGSATTFNIKTTAREGNVKEGFAFLNAGKEDLLLEIINRYSVKNIEIELEQLKKYRNNVTNDIIGFYTGLLEEINKADSKKEAYLRIGSGKTYYFNSIAQKLPKSNLHQIISKTFKKANPNLFPKTRTFIFEGEYSEVPGWVKITKI